jgi:lysophospholipase L1-like esterase
MKKIICLLIFAFATLSANDLMAQTKTIVAFGDSITAPRKNVTTYSDLIREEFQKKHLDVKVVNAGVPGNTTAMAKERFEKDVLARDPDLVIIQLGTNDSAVDVWKKPPATESRVSINDYEHNLREFIAKLKERKAKIILVTPPPTRWTEKLKEMYGKPPYDPNDEDGFNIILKTYIQRMRRVAKDEKVVLVDLNKEYYKYHKSKGRTMDDLFLDGMHPNNKGQKLEAELLLKQIKKLDLGL